MIQITHLLDDFGMGGVTQALTLFEKQALTRIATSKVLAIGQDALVAPSCDADLIVDHMALSWKRLMFQASLRARNPKARIIHVEHSYTRSFEETQVRARPRFRMMLKIASILYDEIVCVSHAQRKWLSDCVGINSEKLRTIYPWTDRFELFDVPKAKRAESKPVSLLAYGRYSSVKNFDQLIEAMRTVSTDIAHLTIFGDGPDRTCLEAAAADMQHVEVFGPTHSPADYLERCDAVIVPSRSEAFGLVATEARMAGRAILVSNIDGLPEQVGNGGFVAPMENQVEIARAIRKAAALDLNALGSNGRAEVASQSAKIISDWSDLISKV